MKTTTIRKLCECNIPCWISAEQNGTIVIRYDDKLMSCYIKQTEAVDRVNTNVTSTVRDKLENVDYVLIDTVNDPFLYLVEKKRFIESSLITLSKARCITQEAMTKRENAIANNNELLMKVINKLQENKK